MNEYTYLSHTNPLNRVVRGATDHMVTTVMETGNASPVPFECPHTLTGGGLPDLE